MSGTCCCSLRREHVCKLVGPCNAGSRLHEAAAPRRLHGWRACKCAASSCCPHSFWE